MTNSYCCQSTIVFKLIKNISNLIIREKPAPPVLLETTETAEEKKLKLDKYLESLEKWYDTSIKVHRDEKQDARKSLDQNLLTLSSGGLALTLTFISFIHGHIHNWQSLLWSWIFFVATIGLTLFSYLLSELVSDQKIDGVQTEYRNDLKLQGIAHEQVNKSVRWKLLQVARDKIIVVFSDNMIDVMNALALNLFIIGITILSIVCWSNFSELQRGKSVSNQESKPIQQQKPRNPDRDRRDEGLRPSDTKPKPLPPPPPPPRPADKKQK